MNSHGFEKGSNCLAGMEGLNQANSHGEKGKKKETACSKTLSWCFIHE